MTIEKALEQINLLGNTIKIKNDSSLRSFIIEKTSHIDHLNPSFSHRIAVLKDGVFSFDDIPKCPSCGKDAQLNRTYPKKGFRTFCSNICQLKSKKASGHDKLSDYDWLYNERIVKRRSIQDIADELGCSHPLVSEYIEKHNFPKIDLKLKMQSISEEYLQKLYVDDRLTCQEIANVTDTSKASVARWLSMYAIKKRPSNAYTRTPEPSKGCLEVYSFIKNHYQGTVVLDDRDVLETGHELDIVVPDKHFAIEYNGLYSHVYRPEEPSPSVRKGRHYHNMKKKLAIGKGYFLLHLWEDDWKCRQDIVKSMILNRLGTTPYKIGARKLAIQEVQPSEKNLFFNENHIQGACRSHIKIGLYKEDELMSCMTFRRVRFRGSHEREWELVRFANKVYWSIPGSFSKLLHWFTENVSASIVSYSDRCYSDGGVYKNNGFVHYRTNGPDYCYVDPAYKSRYHRMSFQKKFLDGEGTEEEIMEQRGFHKLWKCGTDTWVFNKKSRE